jgi:hypothetical protein
MWVEGGASQGLIVCFCDAFTLEDSLCVLESAAGCAVL